MHIRHLITAILSLALTFGVLGIESCRKVDGEKARKTTVDSLVGRWHIQQGTGQAIADIYLTFKKGAMATQQLVLTKGNNRMVASCQGTYTVKSRNIEFKWDRKTMKFTFNDFAMNNVSARDREATVADMKANFVEKGTNAIISLTKDRLVVCDPEHLNGAALSYTRE